MTEPELDADAVALEPLLARIPPRWGRSVGCGRGWWPSLAALNEALAEIDPGYEAHQVKEKFGELRFYAAPSADLPEDARDAFAERVRRGELEISAMCEDCGAPGTCEATNGWYSTLCASCRANRLAARGQAT